MEALPHVGCLGLPHSMAAGLKGQLSECEGAGAFQTEAVLPFLTSPRVTHGAISATVTGPQIYLWIECLWYIVRRARGMGHIL